MLFGKNLNNLFPCHLLYLYMLCLREASRNRQQQARQSRQPRGEVILVLEELQNNSDREIQSKFRASRLSTPSCEKFMNSFATISL